MNSILFPAEWYPQSWIQMALPNADTDWNSVLPQALDCYRNIIREISIRQKIVVICQSTEEAKKILYDANVENLTLLEIPYNDTWARDHGGITVFIDGKPVIYDFCFNGWGMKFAANYDNQITKELFNQNFFGSKVTKKNMKHIVFEGGGIESNGKGTLLTTESCLLSKNRNEHLLKYEIEAFLKQSFGANLVHWLKNGHLIGDDTDGHIDTLARFVDENTIAYICCTDETDEQYEGLKKMENELKALRTKDREAYNLVALPCTPAIYSEEGERLPATYANFLIINGAVLVPTYNCETDSQALTLLQDVFKDREIIGIDCLALIEQHGSLHCATMQYPHF
jgi:agmatine deiminase